MKDLTKLFEIMEIIKECIIIGMAVIGFINFGAYFLKNTEKEEENDESNSNKI